MQLISGIRQLRQNFWLAFAVALAIFAVALVLRYALAGALENAPFITLFPAILVSALVGGLWIGIAVALLSGLAGMYWFLPPYYSLSATWPDGVITMALFLATSAIQLYVVELLSRAMDDLAAARDRSAVMFQELQHRVANNMQFVAGLLQMQEKAVASDPASAGRLLMDIRKRFETMARIHRRLYDPAALSIPLTQYFQDLCTDVLDASGAKNVVCVVEATQAALDAQRMLTLSLLVTEAITNSVKHAFKNAEQGTISIRFDQETEGYALTINDNGPGLPQGFQFEKGNSLGFKIMKSLAAQLGGEVKFTGDAGMTTRLSFPH